MTSTVVDDLGHRRHHRLVPDRTMPTEVIQRNPVEGVQMPPQSHNTKVAFPYEKDEQEKLATAFTEEKKWPAPLPLRMGSRSYSRDRPPRR